MARSKRRAPASPPFVARVSEQQSPGPSVPRFPSKRGPARAERERDAPSLATAEPAPSSLAQTPPPASERRNASTAAETPPPSRRPMIPTACCRSPEPRQGIWRISGDASNAASPESTGHSLYQAQVRDTSFSSVQRPKVHPGWRDTEGHALWLRWRSIASPQILVGEAATDPMGGHMRAVLSPSSEADLPRPTVAARRHVSANKFQRIEDRTSKRLSTGKGDSRRHRKST